MHHYFSLGYIFLFEENVLFINSELNMLDCSICLDPMTNQRDTHIAPCGHKHHRKCIGILNVSNVHTSGLVTCPLCRKELFPCAPVPPTVNTVQFYTIQKEAPSNAVPRRCDQKVIPTPDNHRHFLQVRCNSVSLVDSGDGVDKEVHQHMVIRRTLTNRH